MLLVCPACSARYDIAEGAIGPDGRQVRCAACGHRWRAEQGGGAAASPPEPPLPPEPAIRAPEIAPQPLPDEADDEMPSPFAHDPPFRPRRRWHWRLWMILLLVALVAGLGVVAAVVAFGPDDVARRIGLSGRRVPLGMEITRQPDWRTIAGGSQLFAVTGRIWNPTATDQAVPDIRAELHDKQGRIVYAWTITRPVPQLSAGRSVGFDGAAVDVPASSAKVTVRFVDVTR